MVMRSHKKGSFILRSERSVNIRKLFQSVLKNLYLDKDSIFRFLMAPPTISEIKIFQECSWRDKFHALHLLGSIERKKQLSWHGTHLATMVSSESSRAASLRFRKPSSPISAWLDLLQGALLLIRETQTGILRPGEEGCSPKAEAEI